jgi:hypothetical protein
MSNKFAERFVYVESRLEPGVYLFFSEFRGCGDESEEYAKESAARIIGRGERCMISHNYLGGRYVPAAAARASA